MLRNLLKSLYWIIIRYNKERLKRKDILKTYGKLSNEEIFSKIYKNKLWDLNSKIKFYSGPGSHENLIVIPYVNCIVNFLKKNKNLIVIDLGCGDFNIGSKIFKHSKNYIGIDVVEDLIIYNKQKYSAKNLTFETLDAVHNTLPAGDCILIKEVFQHLTNAEIKKILLKTIKFKYIMITESEPLIPFKPNKDKLKGPECRTDMVSGIIIDKSPFNFKFKFKKELLRVKKEDRYIVTTFYQTY